MSERKARGIDGIEREWTPHERYMLYSRGYQDGTGIKPIRDGHGDLHAYVRGYTDGQEARRSAVSAFAAEIGYEPTILRTQGDGT